jgi:hypothetical protein
MPGEAIAEAARTMSGTVAHPGRPVPWEVVAALALVALLAQAAPGPIAGAVVLVIAAWRVATSSRVPRLLLLVAAAAGGAIGGAVQWFAFDAGVARRLGLDFVVLGDFGEHLSAGALIGVMVVGLLALVVESGTPGAKRRPRKKSMLPVGRRDAPRPIVFLLGLAFIGVLGAGLTMRPMAPSRVFELRYVQRKLEQLITLQAAYHRAAGTYARTIDELGIDTVHTGPNDELSTDDTSFPGMDVVIESASTEGWAGSVAGSARVDPRYLIRCRANVRSDDIERSCWSPNLSAE